MPSDTADDQPAEQSREPPVPVDFKLVVIEHSLQTEIDRSQIFQRVPISLDFDLFPMAGDQLEDFLDVGEAERVFLTQPFQSTPDRSGQPGNDGHQVRQSGTGMGVAQFVSHGITEIRPGRLQIVRVKVEGGDS